MSGTSPDAAAVDYVLLGCRKCRSTKLAAWYTVAERQSVEVFVDEGGNVQIEYDGCTKTGDCLPDDEFVCLDCGEVSRTDEFLVGKSDRDGGKTEESSS